MLYISGIKHSGKDEISENLLKMVKFDFIKREVDKK